MTYKVKAGPVELQERIDSIDILRGFAVLGILIMNIQEFSMISQAYFNPTAYGDLKGSNWLVWLYSHLFADMKFISIFSLLFGAGVLLFTDKAEAKGSKSAGIHYRRTLWLLLFGLLHGYFLRSGGILFYGHGFGLFGFVERTGQILIVFLIWIFEILLSLLWLKRFRFGPFEWLWRSLTYWKLQPMRRS